MENKENEIPKWQKAMLEGTHFWDEVDEQPEEKDSVQKSEGVADAFEEPKDKDTAKMSDEEYLDFIFGSESEEVLEEKDLPLTSEEESVCEDLNHEKKSEEKDSTYDSNNEALVSVVHPIKNEVLIEKNGSQLSPEEWMNLVFFDDVHESDYENEADLEESIEKKKVGKREKTVSKLKTSTESDGKDHATNTELVKFDMPAKKKAKKVKGYSKNGRRKRLRKTFQDVELTGWHEHRILEFLLNYCIRRKDNAEVARTLLNEFGSIENVLFADMDELTKIKGVGEQTAILLHFVAMLHLNLLQEKNTSKLYVRSTEEAVKLFFPYFIGKKIEQCYLLCLDGEYNFLKIQCLGTGDLLSTTLDYRKALSTANNIKGVFFYLAHNHISSSIEPSQEDWQMTESIAGILDLANFYLKDHIIVSSEKKEYVSMRELSEKENRFIFW